MAAFNRDGEEGLSFSKSGQRGRPSFIVEFGMETIQMTTLGILKKMALSSASLRGRVTA